MTGYKTMNVNPSQPFENAAISKQVISTTEMYRMLRDHGLTDNMCPKHVFAALVKVYNQKKGNADNNAAAFEDFLNVLVQTSLYVYSKEPRDLSHL